MEVQNQVIRSLRSDLARLQGLTGDVVSRGQLVDRVCAAFGFRDARGRWQRVTCRKALVVLEAEGHISLPPRRTARCGQRRIAGTVGMRRAGRGRRGRRFGTGPGDGCAAACDLGRGRTSIRAAQGLSWAARYVVGSAHGWLGAVGFASSARWLACRDRWLERRQAARLFAPGRVPVALSDPSRRAGISPRTSWGKQYAWRETISRCATAIGPICWRPSSTRRSGAIFRSANWQHVGKTSGRRRGAAKAPKAVYMYELDAAGTSAHSRTASCASEGRGRSGELGGTGVQRCTAGGCTPERTPGDLRPARKRRCGRSRAQRGEIKP